MERIRVDVDTWGYDINVSTGINLTGNTQLELRFRRADGTVIVRNKTANGVTDNGAPLLGVIHYRDVLVDALWHVPGDVKIVPAVTYSNGYYESPEPMKVEVVERFLG